MSKYHPTQRNKEQSKQKLIDAVGEIIAQKGFEAIGVNSIAKQAKLDKVLIYRYFDGLDGLLREYAKQKDFYINTSESILQEVDATEKKHLNEIITKILIGQLRNLNENKEIQEFMLWEMIEKNELTIAIAREREEKGSEINQSLKNKMQLKDNKSDAVIALLVAGIYYLVLRSRTVDVFNGIEINSDTGREQLEEAIRQIVDSYFK